MKNIFNIITMLALLLATASCDRESISYEKGEEGGETPTPEAQMVELNLRSLLQMEVIEEANESSTVITRANTIDTSEFIVLLYKEDNSLVQQWLHKDMPELISVLQGKYYVKIMSHAIQPVDFKAYYEGTSKIFSVTSGSVTEIEKISCTMKSIKIILTFDSNLSTYLGTDVKVSVKIGSANYDYTDLKNITAVYFAPVTSESNVIQVTFDGTVDGFKENYTRSYNANSGDFLKVKFTLKNVTDGGITSSGTAGLRLTVDLKVTNIRQNSNITTEEDVIPEDPGEDGGDGDENQPTIKGRGFNIKETQDVPKDGLTCIVDITAAMRFAHLYVTIDSETLTEGVLNSVGLKKSFDLAYPGDLEGALGTDENGEGLGFPVGNQVIGQKTLIFDISPFTTLLNIYGAATHKFVIKVVDQAGIEVEETLTLITK